MSTILSITVAVMAGLIIGLGVWVARLKRELQQDPQTRVLNKQAFTKDLNERLTSKRNPLNFISVIFIDLNGFKQINDGLGHVEGDRIIAELVALLQLTLRQGDRIARNMSAIGRFGGDEFYISAETRSLEDLEGIISRLRAEAHRRKISIALGSASQQRSQVTDPDAAVASLLQRADQSMYADKRTSRPNTEPILPS